MRFDYPNPETEIEVVIKQTGIERKIATQLVEMALMLRELKEHDLEESVSTRLLIYTATLIYKTKNYAYQTFSTLSQ